jgi:double-stranded uracil-DNA glycosylase
MNECHSFSASLNQNCHILILGSMPGEASLQKQQYYAHPQNRFWPMICSILGNSKVPVFYDERLQLLLKHNIGLWDSLAFCERSGSLDSAIKHEQANDFPSLFKNYPQIKKICFNGTKAFQAFKKHHKELLQDTQKEFITLPSTSPANARWQMPKLMEVWKIALQT